MTATRGESLSRFPHRRGIFVALFFNPAHRACPRMLPDMSFSRVAADAAAVGHGNKDRTRTHVLAMLRNLRHLLPPTRGTVTPQVSRIKLRESRLEAERDRLREALEWIASDDAWEVTPQYATDGRYRFNTTRDSVYATPWGFARDALAGPESAGDGR